MNATKRQTGLTLPPTMWLYVEDLRATGLYGDALSSVLRHLIACGIQDAIAKRVIPVRGPAGIIPAKAFTPPGSADQ